MKLHYALLSLLGGLLASGTPRPLAAAGLPGDAEAASHGDEAASLQIVEETRIAEPDFVFHQYTLGVLSHYSYLVASGNEILIVDPARDIRRYLDDAKALNARITRIYLTHSHADFVAGHTELAQATGAKVIVNRATGAGYPHEPVGDGDAIAFGRVKGVVLTTPGHTPDGTCLLLYAPADAPAPRLLFTGDTLFIGSVGRPDLMGGVARYYDEIMRPAGIQSEAVPLTSPSAMPRLAPPPPVSPSAPAVPAPPTPAPRKRSAGC